MGVRAQPLNALSRALSSNVCTESSAAPRDTRVRRHAGRYPPKKVPSVPRGGREVAATPPRRHRTAPRPPWERARGPGVNEPGPDGLTGRPGWIPRPLPWWTTQTSREQVGAPARCGPQPGHAGVRKRKMLIALAGPTRCPAGGRERKHTKEPCLWRRKARGLGGSRYLGVSVSSSSPPVSCFPYLRATLPALAGPAGWLAVIRYGTGL